MVFLFIFRLRAFACLLVGREILTLLTSVFLCIFLSPVGFAEFVDEEDIIEEESATSKESWSETENDGTEAEKEKRKKQLRARQEKEKLKQWLTQLKALKRSKKEGQVVSLVSKILNKDPHNIQALNTLGVFYLRAGKTQLAKIIFTRALKKHPKNSSLHANLSVIALKEDKPEEAIKGFQKSLSYRYSNYVSAANLGTLYTKAYEYDQALEPLSLAYSRSKQLLSITHREVLKTGNNYAVALAWAGDFRKSEDIFEELIGKHPGSVQLILNYAILLGKDMKDKEKSYQLLQKADMMDKSGRYTRKIKAMRKYLKTGQAGSYKSSYISML